MTEDEAAFVEAMGQFMGGTGMTPMAGRLWAWLLICDPPAQAAGDLAVALKASRGAISGAAASLASTGMIRRMRRIIPVDASEAAAPLIAPRLALSATARSPAAWAGGSQMSSQAHSRPAIGVIPVPPMNWPIASTNAASSSVMSRGYIILSVQAILNIHALKPTVAQAGLATDGANTGAAHIGAGTARTRAHVRMPALAAAPAAMPAEAPPKRAIDACRAARCHRGRWRFPSAAMPRTRSPGRPRPR